MHIFSPKKSNGLSLRSRLLDWLMTLRFILPGESASKWLFIHKISNSPSVTGTKAATAPPNPSPSPRFVLLKGKPLRELTAFTKGLPWLLVTSGYLTMAGL